MTGDFIAVDALMTPRDLTVEAAFRRHRLGLTRLAFLLTGSREQAEDIVQSAFAAAHPRWAELDQPLAYLRRAVVNLAADGHRRRFRAQRHATPHEGITHIAEIDETWALVQRLPAAQRAVVALRFYEDLPLTEIARVLDRPATTVRSDLHRALKSLRKALP